MLLFVRKWFENLRTYGVTYCITTGNESKRRR